MGLKKVEIVNKENQNQEKKNIDFYSNWIYYFAYDITYKIINKIFKGKKEVEEGIALYTTSDYFMGKIRQFAYKNNEKILALFNIINEILGLAKKYHIISLKNNNSESKDKIYQEMLNEIENILLDFLKVGELKGLIFFIVDFYEKYNKYYSIAIDNYDKKFDAYLCIKDSEIKFMQYNLDINFLELCKIVPIKLNKYKEFFFNLLFITKLFIEKIVKNREINKYLLFKKMAELYKNYFLIFKYVKKALNTYKNNYEKEKQEEKLKLKKEIDKEFAFIYEYNYVSNDIYNKFLEFSNKHLNKKEKLLSNNALNVIIGYINYKYLNKGEDKREYKKYIEYCDNVFNFLKQSNILNKKLKTNMEENEFLRYYIMNIIINLYDLEMKPKEINAIELLSIREYLRNNNIKLLYENDNKLENFLYDIEYLFNNSIYSISKKIKEEIIKIYSLNNLTANYLSKIEKILNYFNAEELKNKKQLISIILAINKTILFIEQNKNMQYDFEELFKKYDLD